MEMIKQYLCNPYIMAAAIGLGVFVGVNIVAPDMLKDYGLTPMNLGLLSAVFYLGYLWWKGNLKLPLLGRRSVGLSTSYVPPPPAEVAVNRAMTTSMADLLSPDQF